MLVRVASAATNGPLKLSLRRRRPRVGGAVPARGLLSTPVSAGAFVGVGAAIVAGRVVDLARAGVRSG
jgi:hypothetical protein